ncbi:alcohol dehydrogenase catalytic domain-containing protein [Nocardia sp. NPDC055053]
MIDNGDATTLTADFARPDAQCPQHMRAARYHRIGEPFSVDEVDRPSPRPNDVIVQVKACGLVPNTVNMLNPPPMVQTPELPAIYGLDPAGVIVETGPLVRGFEVGDRVYVNPLRYCGGCRQCRMGRVRSCDYAALNGYFGTGPWGGQMLADYPYGGYCEFMTAPHYSLVKLPDNVDFETAARWGYLGTSFSALRRANVNMSTTVLINGISGTLGLGAALFALALGAPTILGVGRNAERLDKVKALAPERIQVHSTTNATESIADWAGSLTEGRGVDVVIDALPTGSSPASFSAAAAALARGGTHVNVGGVLEEVPISLPHVMTSNQTYMGSFWFTTSEGKEMADLAGAGAVNLNVFDHEVFGLEDINKAITAASAEERNGGFSNYVISPETQIR